MRHRHHGRDRRSQSARARACASARHSQPPWPVSRSLHGRAGRPASTTGRSPAGRGRPPNGSLPEGEPRATRSCACGDDHGGAEPEDRSRRGEHAAWLRQLDRRQCKIFEHAAKSPDSNSVAARRPPLVARTERRYVELVPTRDQRIERTLATIRPALSRYRVLAWPDLVNALVQRARLDCKTGHALSAGH